MTSEAETSPPPLAPDPLGNEEPERFALEVDAGGLGQALELFGRWLPEIQQMARVVLRLEGVHLVVRFGPDEARVRARGLWPGVVTAPAALLASVHEELAPGSRISLVVSEGRLAVGPRIRIPCEVLPAGASLPRFVELLDEPRLLDLLRMGLRHGPDALRLSGIEGAVRDARGILDEILEDLGSILGDSAEGGGFSADEAAEAIRYFVRLGLGHPDAQQEGGSQAWRSRPSSGA